MLALENKVFCSYPLAVQEALLPHMHLREVQESEKIKRQGKSPSFYFPITAICAQHAIIDGGYGVFTQFIGSNKMVGFSVLSARGFIEFQHEWCCAGYVFELPGQILRDLLSTKADVQLIQMIKVFTRRLTNRLYCAEQHSKSQRLARVLLEAFDVNQSTELIGAKHKKLSEILGTRRETVSSIIGKWQDGGILESARERILLKDRGRLERSACSCYEDHLKIDRDLSKHVSSLAWQLDKPCVVSTDVNRSLKCASNKTLD